MYSFDARRQTTLIFKSEKGAGWYQQKSHNKTAREKATQLFCLSRENNAQKKNNVYFEDPFFPGSTEIVYKNVEKTHYESG